MSVVSVITGFKTGLMLTELARAISACGFGVVNNRPALLTEKDLSFHSILLPVKLARRTQNVRKSRTGISQIDPAFRELSMVCIRRCNKALIENTEPIIIAGHSSCSVYR